jgi:hypothetical protein
LREHLQFDAYLAKHSTDHAYTCRQHLRSIGGLSRNEVVVTERRIS